jgi:hypothetical protein
MTEQTDAYMGQMDPTTNENLFNALTFMVSQVMNGNWTITLGQVKGVKGGQVDSPATVDVQPMVNQVDGYGNATPHGVIYGLPVFRLQGGANAIIIDPVVDDIGIIATASRDISSIVKTKKVSNPGSKRTFAPSDGMYIGGLLGAAPTRYMQVADDGINIVFSPSVSIKITANGIVAKVGSSEFTVGPGGFYFNGINFLTHTHAVTTAPGTTGPPA